MNLSAAQAERFYTEALRHSGVWAIRDAGGYPAPENADGGRAMPFWSLLDLGSNRTCDWQC